MTHLRPALAAALTAGLLTLAGCSGGTDTTSDSPPAQTQVSGQSLDVPAFAELAATDGVVLLDVRTPEEFAAGHLPGATNLDVSAPDFAAAVAELDQDATFAVYCHSGNRSRVALEQMQQAGIGAVADLAGGIEAWTQAGRDVSTAP